MNRSAGVGGSGAALLAAAEFLAHFSVPNRSLIAYMMASGLARQFGQD